MAKLLFLTVSEAHHVLLSSACRGRLRRTFVWCRSSRCTGGFHLQGSARGPCLAWQGGPHESARRGAVWAGLSPAGSFPSLLARVGRGRVSVRHLIGVIRRVPLGRSWSWD